MGPANPLVTQAQYRQTLAKLIETAGMKDTESYFMDPNGQQAQMVMAQAAQAPKKPDPAQMLAQVEIQKIQQQMDESTKRLILEREKMLMEDDRKRDELDARISLDAIELQAKYGTQIDVAELKAQVEREKMATRERGATLRQMMNNAPRGE